jgi:hypothetical protein
MNSESSERHKLLPPDRAIDAANQAIKELSIADWAECGLLKNPQHAVQAPMLLCDDPGLDGVDVSHSYIVPFGIQNDENEFGVPLTRLCILVDATDGTFEEVTAFVDPVAFLPKEAAIRVVASALRIPIDQLGKVDAEWMFRAGEITRVCAYPFWKIVVNGRTYYVDQEGELYTELPRGKGGS